MSDTGNPPKGWYYAEGDPENTQRYWDGQRWEGYPRPTPKGTLKKLPHVEDPALAGVYDRIAARILDLFLWVSIFSLAKIIFGVGVIDQFLYVIPIWPVPDSFSPQVLLSVALGASLIAAYEVVLLHTRQATLGKMALEIKVSTKDKKSVDYVVAMRRIALFVSIALLSVIPNKPVVVLSSLALYLLGAYSVVALFRDRRSQTAWDKLAQTVVVKR